VSVCAGHCGAGHRERRNASSVGQDGAAVIMRPKCSRDRPVTIGREAQASSTKTARKASHPQKPIQRRVAINPTPTTQSDQAWSTRLDILDFEGAASIGSE